MIVQNCILPVVYRMFCIKKIKPGLVIMADGHSVSRPFRMNRIYESLKSENYEVIEWYNDFQAVSYMKALAKMIEFMKLYAGANYVIISDNFLPVASCRKRKQTFVIQLWHGCGAFKKFGYDTPDDIPEDYVGNVFRNYDLVTVSGPKAVKPFTSAMRLPEGVCQSIGVSATDQYYDDGYEDICRRDFYKQCPEAKGKKVLLWAPTFRGSALDPTVPGTDTMESLSQKLGDEWYVIIKYHPHMEAKGKKSSVDIPTERLLPITDILVTDYSSIIFNYAIYRRPVIFYAPDYDDYAGARGFYMDYNSLPGEIVVTQEELINAVTHAYDVFDEQTMENFYREYMSGCDGNATARIIDIMNRKRYAS